MGRAESVRVGVPRRVFFFMGVKAQALLDGRLLGCQSIAWICVVFSLHIMTAFASFSLLFFLGDEGASCAVLRRLVMRFAPYVVSRQRSAFRLSTKFTTSRLASVRSMDAYLPLPGSSVRGAVVVTVIAATATARRDHGGRRGPLRSCRA